MWETSYLIVYKLLIDFEDYGRLVQAHGAMLPFCQLLWLTSINIEVCGILPIIFFVNP